MIRLYKTFIRPLLEYGHTATIIATKHAIKTWENNQAKYIKTILRLPNISHENILKYGNTTTIRTRLNHLILKWYRNLYANNNTPIREFINTHVRNYHELDKYNTPYKIIETQITNHTFTRTRQ